MIAVGCGQLIENGRAIWQPSDELRDIVCTFLMGMKKMMHRID
jgi:hypothetical protein